MKVLIRSNPGSRDYPELSPLPKAGDVLECDEITGLRLTKQGLAVIVPDIQGVPAAPAIAEPKPTEIKAAPLAAKVSKQSEKPKSEG